MDFFHQQDVARRKTTLLVAYFIAAVVLIVLALYAATVAALGFYHKDWQQQGRVDWLQLDVLVLVALGALAVIALGSLFKLWQLRGGGEALATMLGGRRVHPNTSDLAERRLLNVVEEMAIASGVSVPPVFVLDKERGINAFAAGYAPGDAVIGVNRGTVEHLSRDELQGVIAHEFSHILNGDMRLNLKLIGLLHGILLLAVIGYYALHFGGAGGRSRSSGNRGGGGYVVMIGLALVVVGYVGLFFARLIKAAVSRQREYLADASAVQFTRNPDGIGGALKKIGGLEMGSRMATPEAETASHMFFGSAFRSHWFGGFATHPPLQERIHRIDPQFDGRFTPVRKSTRPPVEQAPQKPPPRSSTEALDRMFGRFGGPLTDRFPLTPVLVMAAVGTPNTNHVAYAQRLLQSMPDQLRNACQDVFSARAVVLALLLDESPEIRDRQLHTVEQRLGEVARSETAKLAPLLAAQGATARLPLIEIVASTLQALSASQYKQFRTTVSELVKADRKVDLFEFALQRILIARLDRHFSQARPRRVRYPAINGLHNEIATVLSALAHLGHADVHQAQAAFTQAASTIRLDRTLSLQPRDACSLAAIDQALDKLNQSAPAIKQRVLQAAVVVVAIDGQVTVGEAELLRAVGDFLDCPIPPIFPGALDIPAQAAGHASAEE